MSKNLVSENLPQLRVIPGKDAFVAEVALSACHVLREAVEAQGVAHIALTGGTIGIAVLGAIARSVHHAPDWSRVHFWWGDERFVSRESPDRNALQAREALLSQIDVPDGNIHEMPASDEGMSLSESASNYGRHLGQWAPQGAFTPAFDVTFLGIGPDSHVASLFPNHPDALKETPVIGVTNSPKPPPERISLSYPAINGSKRVWIVAFGDDKALALSKLFRSRDDLSVPSSCVHGMQETVVWADDTASSLI